MKENEGCAEHDSCDFEDSENKNMTIWHKLLPVIL